MLLHLLFVPTVFAASGFVPNVYWTNIGCIGNPSYGVASELVNFGTAQNCQEFIAQTSSLAIIAYQCNPIDGTGGKITVETQCFEGAGPLMPCLNLTTASTMANMFVGTCGGKGTYYQLQPLNCQPYDYSKWDQPPYILAECNNGQGTVSLFSNARCTDPYPGSKTYNLDGQCNPFIGNLQIQGSCQACPAYTPPKPSPTVASSSTTSRIPPKPLTSVSGMTPVTSDSPVTTEPSSSLSKKTTTQPKPTSTTTSLGFKVYPLLFLFALL